MAFGAVGDWLFGLYGNFDLALPAMNVILVICFVIFLKRRFWRSAWFWFAMAFIASLHVPLILYVPWGTKWIPALAFAGIDTLDFCAILVILALVEKFVKGPDTKNLRTRRQAK